MPATIANARLRSNVTRLDVEATRLARIRQPVANALVIQAMGEGKRAAQAIHDYLGN